MKTLYDDLQRLGLDDDYLDSLEYALNTAVDEDELWSEACDNGKLQVLKVIGVITEYTPAYAKMVASRINYLEITTRYPPTPHYRDVREAAYQEWHQDRLALIRFVNSFTGQQVAQWVYRIAQEEESKSC